MKRVFAMFLAALLLVNPLLPGVAIALEEAELQHVTVTPVLTGETADGVTYTSPVSVDFTVAPGDPSLYLTQLEVSNDGVNWWDYNGPLSFSEGTHAVIWRITERDPANGTETTYDGSVHLTVVADAVVPYGFGGFEKPLAADGSSVFRAGETIAVKYSLVDAGGSAVRGAQASLQVARADDPAAVVATGIFRETKAGKYACNLETKNLAPGAYVITTVLDDGESYSVTVTLK